MLLSHPAQPVCSRTRFQHGSYHSLELWWTCCCVRLLTAPRYPHKAWHCAGRRANSQSSQGQEEDQRQVPQDEDMLNVPQPSPAPLMQDVPDFDMPEAPPLGDDLLGDNLEGLDAMLPTPTPSGKSQSRSAGKSRCRIRLDRLW